MYEIILKTWYQEVGNQIEPLPGKFKDLESACKYLGENYEEVIDQFPVEEITIKFNHNLKDKL